MCTSDIKQRYLFLASLNQDGSATTKEQIKDRMLILSEEFFQTTLDASEPETFPNLVSQEITFSSIEPVSHREWRITEQGREDIDYAFRSFIEPYLNNTP